MTQLHGISWHKAPKDYENPDRSFSNWNKVQGKGPKPNMYQGQIDRKTNKMDGRGILIQESSVVVGHFKLGKLHGVQQFFTPDGKMTGVIYTDGVEMQASDYCE